MDGSIAFLPKKEESDLTKSDDPEEGAGNLTEMSSFAPSDDYVSVTSSKVPERRLPRSAATRALPGLVLHVFRIHKDGTVDSMDDSYAGLNEVLNVEASSVAGIVKTDNEIPSYWVDIDADERDRTELNEWIERLHLGSFVTNQITRPTEEWVSHVASTRSKALVMIRILPLLRGEADGTFTFLSDRVEYLAAIKTKHMLMTYTTTLSSGRRSLNKASIAYMTQDEALQDGSSSAALISWLEFHIFRTRTILSKIRTKSVLLVRKLDKDPSSVELSDILQLRDKVLVVRAVAEEQAQCLSMIRKMDSDTDGVDFKNLKGALSILVATAESTERMGIRLEKRGAELKAAFDSHQQDRMNRRLALLTVVSAVFMPLTFMAGIYGMNFVNIPELEYENGYFILLASMLVIAVSMISFFYYHGWFE